MIRKMTDSDKDFVIPLLIEMYEQHRVEAPYLMPLVKDLESHLLLVWSKIADDSDYFHYVYQDNDKVIAYLGLSQLSPYWDFLYPYRKSLILDTLIVNQNHRNKGIAGALIEFSKNLAEELNFETLELYVSPAFPETQEFYQRKGFNDAYHYMSYKK